MTTNDPTFPLRDWSCSRLRRLDRRTLEALASRIGVPVEGKDDRTLAEDIYMDALDFGALTLRDIVPDIEEP